jgi:type II secretory pathway component GspD/PulD (secretin)
VPISSTVSAPVFDLRSASSRVVVHDGDTIVIGGLMEDRYTRTTSKVPILGDIPILGSLLSRDQPDKTKTELLFFLTPHVAQQPGALKSMAQDEENGLRLTPNAVEPGVFQEHMQGLQRGAATTQPSIIVPVQPVEPAPDRLLTPKLPGGSPGQTPAGNGAPPTP